MCVRAARLLEMLCVRIVRVTAPEGGSLGALVLDFFYFFRENHFISGRYHYTTHLHKNIGTRDGEGRRGALATEMPARAQNKTENRTARSPLTYPSRGTQAATHGNR